MILRIMTRPCCDGRRPCRGYRVAREAIAHAESRSKHSRRGQIMRWDNDTWLITEAPPRQNGDRS